jgi:cytochrome P450 family 3 subfamily A
MEIVSNALLFFLAGYETSSTAMAFTFYNLALNEDAQQTLFEEIESALEDNNVCFKQQYLKFVIK